jgi:serine phosphatase RsbU (regulator of sigma subunit)
MNRWRTILVLGAIAIAIVLVFVYDTVRAVVDLDLAGLLILRELMVFAVALAGFVLLTRAHGTKNRNVAREIGRLTIVSGGALFVVGAMMFFGPTKGSRLPDALPQDSVFGILRGIALGVLLGAAALWTVQSVRQLVLFKRRKDSQRNVVIYMSLLATTAFASSPILPLEGSFILSLLVPLTILAGIVLSFRQNWIVYLSRREKLYTLLYAFLSFLFGLLTVVLLAQDHPVIVELQQFSRSVYILSQQTAVLSTIYFGMAFISTLFHMPTAEVFERKQSELSSLHNLTRLTSQLLDFDTLVQTVAQMAQEVCGARAVWLELLSKASDGTWSTQVVAHRDISLNDVDEVRVALGHSYRDLVVEARTVVLVDDTWNDRRTKGLRDVGRLRGSLISVPLTARQELIGILHAAKEMTQGFDQDDVEVLTSLGDHVTIAIENARLISRSIERERLQQELLVARRMQRQLLPADLPRLEHAAFAALSESSMEVGGDYYDLVFLGRDRWGIAVGDVSGKGVSAAFYMAEVKGIVLSLSRICASPKELLVRANESLHGSLDRKAFVSLVYAVLNERTGDLILARAGHCPVVHARGSAARLIRPNGLGLGMATTDVFEGATEEQVLRLEPGDRCVFYTDGITEARNRQGEEFGYDRLLDIVGSAADFSAEQLKSRILAAVRTFADGTAYTDDMTLVVLQWRAPSAGISASAQRP